MSQDFTTRLQLQLREAALRDERRSPFGRRFADLRHGMPAPAAVAAVALAAVLLAIVVAVGGLRWGGGRDGLEPEGDRQRAAGGQPGVHGAGLRVRLGRRRQAAGDPARRPPHPRRPGGDPDGRRPQRLRRRSDRQHRRGRRVGDRAPSRHRRRPPGPAGRSADEYRHRARDAPGSTGAARPRHPDHRRPPVGHHLARGDRAGPRPPPGRVASCGSASRRRAVPAVDDRRPRRGAAGAHPRGAHRPLRPLRRQPDRLAAGPPRRQPWP